MFPLVCVCDRDTLLRTHERRAAMDTVCNAIYSSGKNVR